jgi:hypothetical protein
MQPSMKRSYVSINTTSLLPSTSETWKNTQILQTRVARRTELVIMMARYSMEPLEQLAKEAGSPMSSIGASPWLMHSQGLALTWRAPNKYLRELLTNQLGVVPR